MFRKAITDYTFSNGYQVPKGKIFIFKRYNNNKLENELIN